MSKLVIPILLLLTLALVLAVSASGLPGLFNGLAYDALTKSAFARKTPAPSVVVVEPRAGTVDWLGLPAQVRQLQPSLLVFDGVFPGLSPAVIRELQKTQPVILSGNGGSPAESSTVVAPLVNPYALSEGGVIRKQRLRTKDGRPSLVTTAARLLGNSLPEEDAFLVNFVQAADRLPLVERERLLNGSLVTELIRGRVLYLLDAQRAKPVLHTPLKSGRLSEGVFRAHALDTLLSGRNLAVMPYWGVVLWTICYGVVTFLLMWRMPATFGLPILVVLLASIIICSWGLLSLVPLWAPVFETILATVGVYFIVTHTRRRRMDEEIGQLALEATARIDSQWLPEDFYSSQNYWNQAANLVTQTFSLSRSIFLERIEGDHRVREVKAINCSIDDIYEMRRDYEREPYTSALQAKGPVETFREYFTASPEGERQYITPLLFAGDVRGFWAFGIVKESRKEGEEERMLETIDQFSSELGEMLFRRNQHLTQLAKERNVLSRLLRLETKDASHKQLGVNLRLTHRRLSTMKAMFDSLGSAAILYDLFGRVLQVNSTMLELLEQTEITPFQSTLVDLLHQFTGQEVDQVRRYIRYLVVNKQPITLQIQLEDLKGEFMLILHVVKGIEESTADNVASPFELMGILCVLTDVSRIRRATALKQQLMDRMNIQYRNDLESILLSCGLVTDDRASREQRSRVVEIMKIKVDSLLKSTDEIQQLLEMDLVGVRGIERYPINLIDSLRRSLEDLQPMIEHRQLNLDLNQPSFTTLGFAEPGKLQGVITSLIRFLIEDSIEGGRLQLQLSSTTSEINLIGNSQGFGMPNDRLQRHLQARPAALGQTDGPFRHLHSAINQVTAWGGRLQMQSQVGEGTRFQLTLEGFH